MFEHLVLICLLAVTMQPTVTGDEEAVTAAALESYFNETHGGDGIAFPDQRRPILLHSKTIVPSRKQLKVQVFSPANSETSRRYATAEARKLVEHLEEQSARPVAVRSTSPRYSIATAHIGTCGPEFNHAKFAGAVAVSRPGMRGRQAALIYVEYAGGARAYYVIRISGQWKTEWYVELWGCG